MGLLYPRRPHILCLMIRDAFVSPKNVLHIRYFLEEHFTCYIILSFIFSGVWEQNLEKKLRPRTLTGCSNVS